MFEIKVCKKCMNSQNEWVAGDIKGFFVAFSPNDNVCPYCKNEIKEINISYEEYDTITSISKDIDFIEKMIQLKDEDLIEYNLKMSQFKTQLNQQTQQIKDDNKVKCPKCKSTNIQMVQRKWSPLTGFMTNKVDRMCVNCKHKW